MLQGRAAERELALTDEGTRIQAAYDLLEDDPSLKCVPASISRVWANPNVRIGIEQLVSKRRRLAGVPCDKLHAVFPYIGQ